MYTFVEYYEDIIYSNLCYFWRKSSISGTDK